MTHTDEGTKVPFDWMPLAFANGCETAVRHPQAGQLYRYGIANRILFRLGFWWTRWFGLPWGRK